MDTGNLGVLAGIIISLGFFALIFSIFYLYKRETMAMIERGMDPRIYKAQSSPYQNLKWGLLLIGSGIGLFLAYLLSHTMYPDENHHAALYFSLIGVFGGLGLFISYLIEKKGTGGE
jgi:formate-dependent nitrite reductase membrane component NrfD